MSRLSQSTLVSCQLKKDGCRDRTYIENYQVLCWKKKTKKVKAFIASIAAGSGATVCLDGIRSQIGEVENGILNRLLE